MEKKKTLKCYTNINSSEYIVFEFPENFKDLEAQINQMDENYLKNNNIIYYDYNKDEIEINNEEVFSEFKGDTIYLKEKVDDKMLTTKEIPSMFQQKKQNTENSINDCNNKYFPITNDTNVSLNNNNSINNNIDLGFENNKNINNNSETKINEFENRKNELIEIYNEINQLKESNKELEKKNSELENKIKLLESQNEIKLNQISEKYNNLEKKFIEFENQLNKKELSKKEKEINELKVMNKNLKIKYNEELKKLKEINVNLEKKLNKFENKEDFSDNEKCKNELEEEIDKKCLTMKNYISNYFEEKIKDLSLYIFKENKNFLKKEIEKLNEKKNNNNTIKLIEKKVEQKNEKNIISKCKLCNEKIINKLYKCENCDDFIVCENCNNKLITKEKQHIYNHTFELINI